MSHAQIMHQCLATKADILDVRSVVRKSCTHHEQMSGGQLRYVDGGLVAAGKGLRDDLRGYPRSGTVVYPIVVRRFLACHHISESPSKKGDH